MRPPGAPAARTHAVAEQLDPFDLLGDDGFLLTSTERCLVGWGRALELALPRGLADPRALRQVTEALAALGPPDPLGRPGTGPVALGALPFAPRSPSSLVVPEVLVGVDPAGSWVTVVGADPRSGVDLDEALEARAREVEARRPTPTGSAGTEVARPAPQAFEASVAEAVATIRRGSLRKVVLGRCLEVALPTPPAPAALLGALAATDPTATAFSMPLPQGHFLGASPELVVARHGRSVRSQPLAGTARLETTTSATRQALMGSSKNRQEHDLVVQAVGSALAPFCATLQVPAEPEVLELGTDARLATAVTGELTWPPAGALELLGALHPTPAVAGVPTDRALEFIAGAEPLPRGPWAGAVGWVDGRGDGAFVLGIRSVLLEGRRARLWAGAGIVAASDPAEELAETTLKLQPVRRALDEALAGASIPRAPTPATWEPHPYLSAPRPP